MAAPSPAPSQRPDSLSASALLNTVLQLLQTHPVPLLVPLVVLGILTSGDGGGGGGPVNFDMGPGRGGGPPPWELVPFLVFFGLIALVVGLIVVVLIFLLYTAAWLMTTRAGIDATHGEQRIDLGASFQAIRSHYKGGLLTALLWFVVVLGGFILLVVPGIIAIVGLTPWAAVVLVEGRTGSDALRRAWDLTRGHRIDLFLLHLAAFAATVIGGVLLGWIPIIGGVLAGAVSGAATAALAVLGALYYVRRAQGVAGAGVPDTGAPGEPGEPAPRV